VLLGQAWLRKARETADPGYYVNAGACADVALEIEPGHRLALNLRGFVLLNDHDFRGAKQLATAILALAPHDATAWGTLADAELELGDVPAAQRAVERMLELKPNLASYSRAAHLRWLEGQEGAALELMRLALDAAGDPDDREPRAWLLVQTALMFWHRGDVAGAESGLRLALDVVRDYPPALVGLGRVASARGDFGGAARVYARAFEASPLAETAWLLGEVRELAADATGAIQAYAAAEREGRAGDRRTLSLMHSTRNQRPVEALGLARDERKRRADIYTEDALAWALYRNERVVEAKAAIDRATRFGTKDPLLLFHRGAIYAKAGERAQGRKLIEEALERNPRFSLTAAAEAKRLLAELAP
jgi:tetratricopeptide (TPR) repeat protein